MKPATREQSTAWDLRDAWWSRRDVRLTLTERCVIRTVVGRVSAVSVTGAFATVAGWHVPLTEVLGIGKPTLEDHAAYQRTMVRLRDARIVEEAA